MNIDQQVALAILAALGAVAFLSLIGAWLIVGASWDEYGASRASRGESELRPSGWNWYGARVHADAPPAAAGGCSTHTSG